MFFHVDLHTSLVASPLKSCSTLNINALIFCSPLLFNIYVDSKKSGKRETLGQQSSAHEMVKTV